MNTDKPIQSRWIELLVALCFTVVGVVVVADSRRVGNAWGSDGPQPGYFPFYVGCLILIGSAWVFLQTLINWRRDGGNKLFAQASEWRLMLMMFLPTLAYLISMFWLGLYLSSWLFIASFMIWQGRYTFFKSAIVGFAINAFLFVLFEIWFKLPLPKGPVETWMGY